MIHVYVRSKSLIYNLNCGKHFENRSVLSVSNAWSYHYNVAFGIVSIYRELLHIKTIRITLLSTIMTTFLFQVTSNAYSSPSIVLAFYNGADG